MTTHLIGSSGFIGSAIQRQVGDFSLHCWSHRQLDPEHHFDLLDPSSWQSLLSQKPTCVILLSWPGLPNYNETFHVIRNLPACVELIDHVEEAGLQRLVVAGTCYEYGRGPLKEDQFTEPVNCYAIAKDSLRRGLLVILIKICNGAGLVFSIHLARAKILILCCPRCSVL